jgi:hypothetical protein
MKKFNTGTKASFTVALITTALLSIAASQAISAAERVNPQQAVPKRVNPQSAQQAGLGLGTPFSATCASGFTKAGEQKNGDGTMDWYVCSTPVISCPSYTQKNGLKAHVTPSAIVQLIGGSPDSGGPQKFRVQYKCDYSFNALPEG